MIHLLADAPRRPFQGWWIKTGFDFTADLICNMCWIFPLLMLIYWTVCLLAGNLSMEEPAPEPYDPEAIVKKDPGPLDKEE